MKSEDVFFDAVTNIREELIEEAQQYVFRRRIAWRKYAGIAACLALVLGMCLLSVTGGMGGSSGGNSGSSDGWNGIAGEPEGVQPDEKRFIADVLEVNADSLIVVPQPGSGIWSVSDRVTVPLDQVSYMPDVRTGDRIRIAYSGSAESDYVWGVYEIVILDSLGRN